MSYKFCSTVLSSLVLSGMALTCVPGNAQGTPPVGVSLAIDDSTDGNPSLVGSAPYGFDPNSFNLQQTIEGLDLHGEYFSQTVIPNGQSISVNINFIDPEVVTHPFISDTLNIVFTGHSAVPGDLNNVSVDLHFRSDEEVSLPPLVNGISFVEVSGFMSVDAFIVEAGGPSDFHVSVQSVPEPSTFILVGLGIASLVTYRLGKRTA